MKPIAQRSVASPSGPTPPRFQPFRGEGLALLFVLALVGSVRGEAPPVELRSAPLASEPAPEPTAEAGSVPISGVTTEYDLNVPAVNSPSTVPEEWAERLRQTEIAIEAVQRENRELRSRLDARLDDHAIESTASAVATTPPAVKRKWFETINLRGYVQVRHNTVTHVAPGSAVAQHAGDASIGPDQEFLIRRARLVFFGDISDHLSIYFQPDFASTPNGAVDSNQFTQIRDWYGDVYLDKGRVHRLRIGQSKVPYGFENMQSSQNRIYLDRNDAFNSATKNERDLGIFYYWTPPAAQETFKYIADNNLKGSGNYGIFGFGAYNGQGGSLREFNDEVHWISRLTLPHVFENGQIIECGIQGYVGRYVVLGSPIAPLGVGPAITPTGTFGRFGDDGLTDQRLGWSLIHYAQPLGFQVEYTIGRGPQLNAAQTAVEVDSLHGGYAMINYRHRSAGLGEFWPFVRWQTYDGGYKNARNAPASRIDEWNFGVEWQMRPEMELACEYLITDRTNLRASPTGRSYEAFVGDVLRFQFQFNF